MSMSDEESDFSDGDDMPMQKIDVVISLAESSRSADILNLVEDKATIKLLANQHSANETRNKSYEGKQEDSVIAGDASELPVEERVLFSDHVHKINRKGTAQGRTLLVTDRAVYNLEGKSLKRRLFLEDCSGLTLCREDDSFALHVQDDYDYHFSSARRSTIARTLAAAYAAVCGHDLAISLVDDHAGLLLAVTTRKQFEQRQKMLTQKAQSSALTNKVRGLVSKKKRRFQEDGFDLDLSYINPSESKQNRIIAMGYPSQGKEANYRNDMADVVRFFDEKHQDAFRFYNLCSERAYDAAMFQGRVRRFPFDDHNPPALRVMLQCCEDVDAFLREDDANCAAIHCKAGKGRTGTIIAAYLVFAGDFAQADAALRLFGQQRTHNGKGVTIPSQIRYVHYFQRYLEQYHRLRLPFDFRGRPKQLKRVRFNTVPAFDTDGGSDPFFWLTNQDGEKLFDSRLVKKPKHFGPKQCPITLPSVDEQYSAALCGDIKFTFFDYDFLSSDDPMFHCWLNTSFIDNNYVCLTKAQLDRAVKDTSHKEFTEDFKVEFWFEDDNEAAERMKAKPVSAAKPTSRRASVVPGLGAKKVNADELFERMSKLELRNKELESQVEDAQERIVELEAQVQSQPQ